VGRRPAQNPVGEAEECLLLYHRAAHFEIVVDELTFVIPDSVPEELNLPVAQPIVHLTVQCYLIFDSSSDARAFAVDWRAKICCCYWENRPPCLIFQFDDVATRVKVDNFLKSSLVVDDGLHRSARLELLL
jgi:hypothetical protein